MISMHVHAHKHIVMVLCFVLLCLFLSFFPLSAIKESDSPEGLGRGGAQCYVLSSSSLHTVVSWYLSQSIELFPLRFILSACTK